MIHTLHSGFPHSNTLSVECGVLSIRHKCGARSVQNPDIHFIPRRCYIGLVRPSDYDISKHDECKEKMERFINYLVIDLEVAFALKTVLQD